MRNRHRGQAHSAESQNKRSADPAETRDAVTRDGVVKDRAIAVHGEQGKRSRFWIFFLTCFYILVPIVVAALYWVAPLKSYIGSAFAFSLIAALLAIDPRLSAWRNRNAILFNFVLTIAATFVGVFFGLYATTKEAERVEMERATRFLEVAKEDLNSVARQMGVFMMGMKDESDADFSGSDLAQRNPRPSPETFVSILGNDVILRRVSPRTLSELINCRRNMNTAIRLINDEKLPNKKLKPIVDVYGKELYHAEQILTAEIEFMNGRIDQRTLEGMQQMFVYQKLGLSPEKIDDIVKHPSKEPLDWNNLGKEKRASNP